MGGLCFVCLNRIAPGVIHHLGAGKVILGQYKRPAERRTHDVAAHFKTARIPCEVSENLKCSQWEKLVWNLAFNGLGVAGIVGYDTLETYDASVRGEVSPKSSKCLSTGELLGDPKWSALVRELMLEVIAAGRALGCLLADSLADEQIAMTQALQNYKASTLIDFEQGRPMELESMFLEPLRRARLTGLPMKRLSTVCTVLTKLNQSRFARGPTN